MKKYFKLIISLLFICLILAGCGSSTGNGKDQDDLEDYDELIYATTSDAPGLSPIDTNDSVTSDVTIQIYETLFVLDPETMEPQPLLAESYETPDDNTWEIKLKEGIEFHDGTPFNAESVKYTFDQLKDPDRGAPRGSLLAPVESIEIGDEYTVILKTTEPYGPMLAVLSHTNAAIVSPTADQEGDNNKDPVGTGPFVFDEWIQGDRITLKRNDNYWREPAQLKNVTYLVVPDISTAISMLETGDVNLIINFPSDHLSRVESLKGVEVQKSEGTRVSYFGFNMEKEPFTDLAFRQAVAYAIDQEAYVNQLNGLGIHNESIIGPKIFGYNNSDQKESYPHDPEKAKQLVTKNGYKGEELTILVSDTDNYMKMAEIVQSQLIEIGLEVKIESMEWGAFLDAAREGNFETLFLGWSNSTADGSELLYPNLHSANIGSTNYSRYNNTEFDKIVDESRTIVDQEARKDILSEANVLAIKDVPWIIMEHGTVTAAYDQSVQGLLVSPNSDWFLYDVKRR